MKETLARGEVMRAARSMVARYRGTCADCAQPIDVGDPIMYRRPDAVHAACTMPETPTTTHRDRMEARAERRDGWAETRAARADAGFARADELASVIPFGQPILVGHYSEGRDRNYRARIEATGFRALADHRMAEHHASTADGIRIQLRTSIYDDDPHAVEQLRAKLAQLEAERAAINAYNKAVRKGTVTPEHVAALAPKWRSRYADRGETVAAYAAANLSGNITRTRQRIARLSA